ncbi:MAG TPA: hypothetical protein PKN32_06105 [Bacteroidales bacterium]|nr:hypothetical protein [Bacteroidales bacterium]
MKVFSSVLVSLVLIILASGFSGCDKNNEFESALPDVSLETIDFYKESGQINFDAKIEKGLSEKEIIEYGICKASNPEPSTTDKKIVLGTGTADQKISTEIADYDITGPGRYYFRLYATNENGTNYSDVEYLDVSERDFIPEFVATISKTGIHILRCQMSVYQNCGSQIVECGLVSSYYTTPEDILYTKNFGPRTGIFVEEVSFNELANTPGYYYINAFVQNQDTIIYGNAVMFEYFYKNGTGNFIKLEDE